MHADNVAYTDLTTNCPVHQYVTHMYAYHAFASLHFAFGLRVHSVSFHCLLSLQPAWRSVALIIVLPCEDSFRLPSLGVGRTHAQNEGHYQRGPGASLYLTSAMRLAMRSIVMRTYSSEVNLIQAAVFG